MPWKSDIQPSAQATRAQLLEWLIRNFRKLGQWIMSHETGADPHPIYEKKLPSMVMGETADSFTLNTTDSKIVNYTLAAESGGSGNINAAAGEITIPADGVYTLLANVLGLQGNSTKEEWLELKLDVAVVAPERYTIGFLDVTTDKTATRQVQSYGSRQFSAGSVVSLWLWASASLGTFTIAGVSFELHQLDV